MLLMKTVTPQDSQFVILKSDVTRQRFEYGFPIIGREGILHFNRHP